MMEGGIALILDNDVGDLDRKSRGRNEDRKKEEDVE